MNLRPSGYEPDELPCCSTPRCALNIIIEMGSIPVAETSYLAYADVAAPALGVVTVVVDVDVEVLPPEFEEFS